MCSHRLTAAHGLQAFIGFGLNVDLIYIDLERRSQPFAHRFRVRHKLGSLGHNGRVDVHDSIPLLSHQFNHAREKLQTRSSRPSRIAIGKVRADVAKRSSSQQSVANRVRQHVRIRVPEQAFLKWNLHAAENELSPFNQQVYVVTYPYASRVVHFTQSKNSACIASASRRSNGRVILMFIGEPSTTDTR